MVRFRCPSYYACHWLFIGAKEILLSNKAIAIDIFYRGVEKMHGQQNRSAWVGQANLLIGGTPTRGTLWPFLLTKRFLPWWLSCSCIFTFHRSFGLLKLVYQSLNCNDKWCWWDHAGEYSLSEFNWVALRPFSAMILEEIDTGTKRIYQSAGLFNEHTESFWRN